MDDNIVLSAINFTAVKVVRDQNFVPVDFGGYSRAPNADILAAPFYGKALVTFRTGTTGYVFFCSMAVIAMNQVHNLTRGKVGERNLNVLDALIKQKTMAAILALQKQMHYVNNGFMICTGFGGKKYARAVIALEFVQELDPKTYKPLAMRGDKLERRRAFKAMKRRLYESAKD